MLQHEEATRIQLGFDGDETLHQVFECMSGEEQQAQAQSWIDWLDQVMDKMGRGTDVYKLSLHNLRQLCCRAGRIPKACHIPGTIVLEVPHPVSQGGYSDVYRGTYGGCPVAVKALRVHLSERDKLLKAFCSEVVCWKQLIHPNIVPFWGVSDMFPVCLVSPWMENGCIDAYIQRNPARDRTTWIVDVTEGLWHIHNMGMVHGDLKGSNVLLNDGLRACLADFGLSRMVDTAGGFSGGSGLHGGSLRWAAPETILEMDNPENARPTVRSDVYSLASVWWEIMAGQKPFAELRNDVQVLTARHQGRALPRLDNCNEEFFGLMRQCWDLDPYQRPASDTLLVAARRLVMTANLPPYSSVTPSPPTLPQTAVVLLTSSLPDIQSNTSRLTQVASPSHSPQFNFINFHAIPSSETDGPYADAPDHFYVPTTQQQAIAHPVSTPGASSPASPQYPSSSSQPPLLEADHRRPEDNLDLDQNVNVALEMSSDTATHDRQRIKHKDTQSVSMGQIYEPRVVPHEMQRVEADPALAPAPEKWPNSSHASVVERDHRASVHKRSLSENELEAPVPKRKRGRPPGSKNKKTLEKEKAKAVARADASSEEDKSVYVPSVRAAMGASVRKKRKASSALDWAPASAGIPKRRGPPPRPKNEIPLEIEAAQATAKFTAMTGSPNESADAAPPGRTLPTSDGRSYLGIRSFPCQWCDRTFTRQADQYQHERDDCRMRPRAGPSLERANLQGEPRAEATDSPHERTFTCDLCGRRFRKVHHFNRHLHSYEPGGSAAPDEERTIWVDLAAPPLRTGDVPVDFEKLDAIIAKLSGGNS